MLGLSQPYTVKNSKMCHSARILVPTNPLKVTQIVGDIIIGAYDQPCDATYMYEFFKTSTPTKVEIRIVLNQRATFRWCASPDQEIYLKAGDVLNVRYHRIGSSAPVTPAITMRGMEINTKRVIVDQSFYSTSEECKTATEPKWWNY